MVAAVVDLHERAHGWEPVDDPGHPVAERGVEYQHLAIAVIDQVRQLIAKVAAVHVHRHEL